MIAGVAFAFCKGHILIIFHDIICEIQYVLQHTYASYVVRPSLRPGTTAVVWRLELYIPRRCRSNNISLV